MSDTNLNTKLPVSEDEIASLKGSGSFTEEEEGVKDGGKSFPVSIEEFSVIKAELALSYPEQLNYLSDAYINSVASKPYSKDTTVRRPLEYTISKLKTLLTWRVESGATSIMDDVENAKISVKQARDEGLDDLTYDKAVKLANTMNKNSIYVHGYDKEGRPIIWLRTCRKPWIVADVDAEVKMHILMTDFAISSMPSSVTDFVVVSDSTSPPPPSPSFLVSTLKGLVKGYPDRLKMLYSAPFGTVLSTVMGLLVPLMPGALGTKLRLMNEKEEMYEALKDVLSGGEADIPTFFGGPKDHDVFYPKDGIGSEADFESLGEGVLMFDWEGMRKRQMVMMEEFNKT